MTSKTRSTFIQTILNIALFNIFFLNIFFLNVTSKTKQSSLK